jgi:hypothetical protein
MPAAWQACLNYLNDLPHRTCGLVLLFSANFRRIALQRSACPVDHLVGASRIGGTYPKHLCSLDVDHNLETIRLLDWHRLCDMRGLALLSHCPAGIGDQVNWLVREAQK